MQITMPLNNPQDQDEPRWDSSASDLAIRVPGISPGTLCCDAFRHLEDNPHWPSLAVIDGRNAVLGLVAREKFLSILSKPLMLDLYSRRPVERIMLRSPLIVEIGENIDSVLNKIAGDANGALVNGFIVTENGAYIGVATAQDLLVKSVEQARQRSKALELARLQAEQASLAKSNFLANLSHEIRTPLNGVLANLELLSLTSADQEQGELIGSAAIAAQALFEIIGDVLDLSKIEAGKFLIEEIPMDPARVMADIGALVTTQALSRNLSFECHIPPSALVTVQGDPTRLRQILMNLCGNALKFTKQGGLFLSLFPCRMEDGGFGLWLEIADTGIGFKSDKSETLFEAFTQEDESTTREYGGTGLGLSICRRLTELMGGTIQADSKTGGGATFWCRIPFPVIAEAEADLADIEGLAVLVIDRQRSRAERLAGSLLAGGAKVLTSSSLAKGLRLLATAQESAEPFDIVLFAAPKGGQDFVALMAGLKEFSAVPVLISDLEDVWLRRWAFFNGIRYWTLFSSALVDTHMVLAKASGRIQGSNVRLPGLDVASQCRILSSSRDARILVIDDIAMNRDVTERQLARLGLSCDLAENGLKGLELARSRVYDLILSDIQMPEMDGYTFTQVWREWETNHNQQRIPVIAMTANAMGGDDRKCFDAGMDDYLPKPIKIERLANMLTRWLDQSSLPCLTFEDAKTCPIDRQALAEQMDDESPETHRQILDMFLEYYPQSQTELDQAITARDRNLTSGKAHGAKGAARNVAAAELSLVLQQIEDKAACGDWDDIIALNLQAHEHYRRIEAFSARFQPPFR